MAMVGTCRQCQAKKKTLKHNQQTGSWLCRKCQRQQVPPKTEICAKCGRDRVVYTRDSNGQAICNSCGGRSNARYHDRRTWKKCAYCGHGPKPVAQRAPKGPKCHACYQSVHYTQRPRLKKADRRSPKLKISTPPVIQKPDPSWLFCRPCGRPQPSVVMVGGVGYCRSHFARHMIAKKNARGNPPLPV